MNIELIIAELVERIPDLAKECAENRERIVRSILSEQTERPPHSGRILQRLDDDQDTDS